ncbi:20397_t:CDS:1, partial [Gigaspora rosea]
ESEESEYELSESDKYEKEKLEDHIYNYLCIENKNHSIPTVSNRPSPFQDLEPYIT